MKLGIMTRRKKIRNDAGTPVIVSWEDANGEDQCAKVENEDKRNQRGKHGSAPYISGEEIENAFPTHRLLAIGYLLFAPQFHAKVFRVAQYVSGGSAKADRQCRGASLSVTALSRQSDF